MLVTKSTIAVALSLFSLTNAIPTGESSLLTAREEHQCKPGTNYYKCSNGFDGCCSAEACNPGGCPDETPACKDGKIRIYQPAMQTIQDGADPVSATNIDLYRSATEERYQTLTFTLPKKANSCVLGWHIPAERNFQASKNHAVVRIWEGTNSLGSSDFAYWPDTPGPRNNTMGPITCEQKVLLTSKLDVTPKQLKHDNQTEAYVSLVQNEQTGWYVEYDC
ncbi:hypothetical protein N7492_004096 [Penicillium capsulatum]|uniref:Chitin-binding type-4 domain-containing protein n=1 Tax=Penicillium capsulatum TaxID=69766 RepID=A0A9W9ISA0_9EURO|nr:hypothetical protein N7492_004096 [Penicillium capsulatum]KAJ6121331.1 hypothetical protein N7512_003796 [Penicillium capsulatum]